jgi:hypothetical protein
MSSLNCERCGIEKPPVRRYQKEAKDYEQIIGLCVDCRPIERRRIRSAQVPTEAILEAVRRMKEQVK